MFVLGAHLPASAQLSPLKKVVEGPKPEQPLAEKADDVRKRLELWHQKAREDLERFEQAGGKTALPEGVTAADLDDRCRDLEQIAITTTSVLKNLNTVADARKAADAARAADAAWTGFKETPPYSVLMMDDLLNEREAVQTRLSSHAASLANFERLLGNALVETKAAEDAVSRQVIAVQNADDQTSATAKWRLESARMKARLMAVRASYLQASCDALKERISAAKADAALTERKIATASPETRFEKDDLAKIEKLAKERKNSVEKELTAVSKRLKSAFTQRNQVQEAVEALPPPATDGVEADGHKLAKFRVELADLRIETLQSVSEQLESLNQLETIAVTAYRERYALTKSATPADRTRALEAMNTLAERLDAWLTVVDNELATCWANLSAFESRAASIAVEDPRYSLVDELRAAHSEKLAMNQRVRQVVSTQGKLIRRWIDDHSPKTDDVGLTQRMSLWGRSAWDAVKKIWSFEVMSFEGEKVVIDGQTFTGAKIPVPLGMLLRALLFFLIGYWVATRVANRVQTTIVTRGRIAEAQARTLRNWVMIIVVAALVLGTLKFLHIPLTVFAFFGGALAIGVGFGTQTLIKNFISGIIVLAERKVRVGDILDVDGVVGTVVEVNTRSSIIRSADDVETMIPNSLFLENRVTNWTLSSPKMRRSLRVGVAYGADTRKVMDVLTECAGRHGRICKEPDPFAVFEDFGGNAMIFILYFWVELGPQSNVAVITSDLRLMIEKRFGESGIALPTPQREAQPAADALTKLK